MSAEALRFRGEDDLRAQAAVERLFPGWQVYRALFKRTVRPDIEIPKDHYWAAHFEFRRPCVVGRTLEILTERLASVDQELINEAVTLAKVRFPQWRVRYLRRGARVHGLDIPPGRFCAERHRGFNWRHVSQGHTAQALISNITAREADLREREQWSGRTDLRVILRRPGQQ